MKPITEPKCHTCSNRKLSAKTFPCVDCKEIRPNASVSKFTPVTGEPK